VIGVSERGKYLSNVNFPTPWGTSLVFVSISVSGSVLLGFYCMRRLISLEKIIDIYGKELIVKYFSFC